MLLYLYNTGLTQMSKILSPFSGGVSGEGDFALFFLMVLFVIYYSKIC